MPWVLLIAVSLVPKKTYAKFEETVPCSSAYNVGFAGS